jgi:hypothetical protein
MVKSLIRQFLPGDVRERTRQALVRLGYYSRPSFLVIGGVKCGTTALYRYLCDHPRIVGAYDKEVHFFDQDISYVERGVGWYHAKFPAPFRMGPRQIAFEATPSYLYQFPRSAQRIFDYDANLKLIALVRSPESRAYSYWNMLRVFHSDRGKSILNQADRYDPSIVEECRQLFSGGSLPSFETLVRKELKTIDRTDLRPEMSFVRAGLYAEQLEHYFELFPREQVLVLDSKQLMRETRPTLDRITDFLDLPSHEWSAYTLEMIGAYPYEEPLDGDFRAELRDFYRPHNERLYQLLGEDFGW